MGLLLVDHRHFLDHDTGAHHPERPARVEAVRRGVAHSPVADAVVHVEAPQADRSALLRVHPERYVSAVESFCAAGGGHLDADTVASVGSWDAAVRAAGAGVEAVRRLRAGEADAAFCIVRPPGHHATPNRAMGFCLFNNIAVAAAEIAAAGERVLVVDFDAHHGNGTQDAFYDRGDVTYVSWHQSPLYPGTGAVEQIGEGAGVGATLNLPMPAHATGEHYRRSIEQVLAPLAEANRFDWLLLSAGFDAHVRDPLTDLALTSGDVADLVLDLVQLVPPGRVLAMLEGGYDLEALESSTAACVSALLGERHHPERPSAGGPGSEAVERVVELRHRLAAGDAS